MGKLMLDLLVSHFNGGLDRRKALILSELRNRLGGDSRLKGKAFVIDFQHLDIGGINRLDARSVNGLGICLGIKGVHRVLIEHPLAVHFFYHCTGRLPFTEAGDGNLLHVLGDSGVNRLPELLTLDLNGEFGAVGLHLIRRYQRHFYFLLFATLHRGIITQFLHECHSNFMNLQLFQTKFEMVGGNQ